MTSNTQALDKALLDRGWTRISDTSYEYATIHQHTRIVIRHNDNLTVFYQTRDTGGSTLIKSTTPPLRAAREATRIALQTRER
jgi:hypothetical protein